LLLLYSSTAQRGRGKRRRNSGRESNISTLTSPYFNIPYNPRYVLEYGKDPKGRADTTASNEDCLILEEGVVFFRYGWDHPRLFPNPCLAHVPKNCLGMPNAARTSTMTGLNPGALRRWGGAPGYETMHVCRYASCSLRCFCSWIETAIGITSTSTVAQVLQLGLSPPSAGENGGTSHA